MATAEDDNKEDLGFISRQGSLFKIATRMNDVEDALNELNETVLHNSQQELDEADAPSSTGKSVKQSLLKDLGNSSLASTRRSDRRLDFIKRESLYNLATRMNALEEQIDEIASTGGSTRRLSSRMSSRMWGSIDEMEFDETDLDGLRDELDEIDRNSMMSTQQSLHTVLEEKYVSDTPETPCTVASTVASTSSHSTRNDPRFDFIKRESLYNLAARMESMEDSFRDSLKDVEGNTRRRSSRMTSSRMWGSEYSMDFQDEDLEALKKELEEADSSSHLDPELEIPREIGESSTQQDELSLAPQQQQLLSLQKSNEQLTRQLDQLHAQQAEAQRVQEENVALQEQLASLNATNDMKLSQGELLRQTQQENDNLKKSIADTMSDHDKIKSQNEEEHQLQEEKIRRLHQHLTDITADRDHRELQLKEENQSLRSQMKEISASFEQKLVDTKKERAQEATFLQEENESWKKQFAEAKAEKNKLESELKDERKTLEGQISSINQNFYSKMADRDREELQRNEEYQSLKKQLVEKIASFEKELRDMKKERAQEATLLQEENESWKKQLAETKAEKAQLESKLREERKMLEGQISSAKQNFESMMANRDQEEVQRNAGTRLLKRQLMKKIASLEQKLGDREKEYVQEAILLKEENEVRKKQLAEAEADKDRLESELKEARQRQEEKGRSLLLDFESDCRNQDLQHTAEIELFSIELAGVKADYSLLRSQREEERREYEKDILLAKQQLAHAKIEFDKKSMLGQEKKRAEKMRSSPDTTRVWVWRLCIAILVILSLIAGHSFGSLVFGSTVGMDGNTALNGKILSLQSEKANVITKLKETVEGLKRSERKLVELQNASSKNQHERMILDDKVEAVRQEKTKVETRLEIAEKKLVVAKTSFESQLVASRQKSTKADEKAELVLKKLEVLKSEKSSLESKHRNAEKMSGFVDKRLSELQQEALRATKETAVLEGQIKTLQNERASIETKLTDTENALNELHKNNNSLRQEANEALKQKAGLEKKIKALESEKAGFENKFRVARKSLEEVERKLNLKMSAPQSCVAKEKPYLLKSVWKPFARFIGGARTLVTKVNVGISGAVGATVGVTYQKVLAIVKSGRGKLVSEEGAWLQVQT